MDLREQRRLDTADLIRRKALEIMRNDGAEALTVEAICEAAGISVRTFFNYFPYKEAALVFPPPAFPEEAVAAFLASDGDLMQDLIALFVAQARLISGDRRAFPIFAAIAQAFPKVVPLQTAQFHAFDTELADLIARRTARPSGDLGCRMLASAFAAANKSAIDAWLEADGHALPAWVERALSDALALARGQTHQH